MEFFIFSQVRSYLIDYQLKIIKKGFGFCSSKIFNRMRLLVLDLIFFFYLSLGIGWIYLGISSVIIMLLIKIFFGSFFFNFEFFLFFFIQRIYDKGQFGSEVLLKEILFLFVLVIVFLMVKIELIYFIGVL